MRTDARARVLLWGLVGLAVGAQGCDAAEGLESAAIIERGADGGPIPASGVDASADTLDVPSEGPRAALVRSYLEHLVCAFRVSLRISGHEPSGWFGRLQRTALCLLAYAGHWFSTDSVCQTNKWRLGPGTHRHERIGGRRPRGRRARLAALHRLRSRGHGSISDHDDSRHHQRGADAASAADLLLDWDPRR